MSARHDSAQARCSASGIRMTSGYGPSAPCSTDSVIPIRPIPATSPSKLRRASVTTVGSSLRICEHHGKYRGGVDIMVNRRHAPPRSSAINVAASPALGCVGLQSAVENGREAGSRIRGREESGLTSATARRYSVSTIVSPYWTTTCYAPTRLEESRPSIVADSQSPDARDRYA